MSDKTVLIVDDEIEIRELLKTLLEGFGFIAKTAANGEEALKTLRQQHFDLLVLDNQMPVMTGEEMLRTYSGEKPHDQKIIYCTGKSLSLMKLIDDNNFFVCVDHVLNKPFNVTKLKDVIDEIF